MKVRAEWRKVSDCQPHPFHRVLLRSSEFDEMPQSHGLDHSVGEVQAGRRIEVEGRGLFIEEPLAGGVEFLEDILDKPVLIVRAPAADLPTALIRHGSAASLPVMM